MASMRNREWDVYMSGALSDLSPEEYKRVTIEIYERVSRICEGMSLKCYCPHQSKTTPTKGMPHSKVWKIDYERVVNSGAIVAYVGIPALGVGAEIEMARTANVPVILLCEATKQERLSRLILGSPAVVDIVLFENPAQFEALLQKPLFHVFSKRNLEDAAYEEGWPLPRYRQLERTLEESLVAGKFRNLPKMPISKEQWKKMPEVADQRALFDE